MSDTIEIQGDFGPGLSLYDGDPSVTLNAMLASMRIMRDAEYGEIRSAYNAACDRLDVLISRLHERSKACQSMSDVAWHLANGDCR